MIEFLAIAMSFFAFFNSLRLLEYQKKTFEEIRKYNENCARIIEVPTGTIVPFDP